MWSMAEEQPDRTAAPVNSNSAASTRIGRSRRTPNTIVR
jgi:hypothetical protein